MDKRNLLEHHIYFLSTHRGERKSREQLELIHSDKSFFNIAFALSSESIETVSSAFNLYLPDWINVNDNKLKDWKLSGGITYMALSGTNHLWKLNKAIEIKKASTLHEMEDFSLVQGKGFCETEDDFKEWYPWMREKNMKNFENSNQSFYVAYKKEKPIGVSLSIIHDGIAGIYAVTTLPGYRKQGVSTTIMKTLMEDCKKNNIPLITLQVNTNSYAHHFYRKLGFTNEFECKTFQRGINT